MSEDRRKATGDKGEQLACRYLLARGYRIVTANWRCRAGELDIVAEDGDTLVFVEVRSRSGRNGFGLPVESVDRRKQRKVVQVAMLYMQQARAHGRPVRFDVIGVMLARSGEPEITHIPGAFS